MRGMPVFATLIMGLPVAVFVTTWVLTDGAPMQAPGHRAGKPAVAGPQPAARPGQPSVEVGTAGGPAPLPVARMAVAPPDAPKDDWDRLAERAAEGDRDALLFLTLMRMAEHGPVTGRSGP